MELIRVSQENIGEQTVQTVKARDLHSFLEVGKDFSTWIKDRIEQFGFAENQDFIVFPEIGGKGGRPQHAYHLSLDMAKEISMVERNDRGKQARQYFIECERRLKLTTQNQLPGNYKEALLHLIAQVEVNEKMQKQIDRDRPKVEFAETVRSCPATLSMNEFAKVLGTGRNRLFRWLRDKNYLMADNLPYQRYVDSGWFRVIEQIVTIKDEDVVKTKTLITGKGQVALEKKWREAA